MNILLSGFVILLVFSAIQHFISRLKGYVWIFPIPIIFLFVMFYLFKENIIESTVKLYILSIIGTLLLLGEGIRTKNAQKNERRYEMEKMKKKDL